MDKLYHHFIRIDKDGNGVLDSHELMSIPSVGENPLAKRLMEVIDLDKESSVDFNEFVGAASIFSSETVRQKKIKCRSFCLPLANELVAFDIYDLDSDGYISNGELFLALRIMSGDHLSPVELQQVVDKTIRDCDSDGDGKISFDEFSHLVDRRNADFFKLWSFKDL